MQLKQFFKNKLKHVEEKNEYFFFQQANFIRAKHIGSLLPTTLAPETV